MTLNDLLKRVDVEKDGNKVIILVDYCGACSNVDGNVVIDDGTIKLIEDTKYPLFND